MLTSKWSLVHGKEEGDDQIKEDSQSIRKDLEPDKEAGRFSGKKDGERNVHEQIWSTLDGTFRINITRRQKVGGKVAEISYREEHCTGDADHTSLRQKGLFWQVPSSF